MSLFYGRHEFGVFNLFRHPHLTPNFHPLGPAPRKHTHIHTDYGRLDIARLCARGERR